MREVLMIQNDTIPVQEWDDAFADMPLEETAAYRDWLARFEAEAFAACEFDI
jgi:hypothetical protein